MKNLKDEVIANIAKKDLNIDTLETRNRDSLDFHDIPVWTIKKALESAYNAGFNEAIAREFPDFDF